jgi:hypothetical protein
VIPERPSKEEARQALNIPIDIIKDFPFDGVRRPKGQDQAPSASRSVALSFFMRGLIRQSLKCAPAHDLVAMGQISNRRLFPHRLQGDFRLQRPHRSCVSSIVIIRSVYQTKRPHSNLAAGPKIGVHFIICDQK